VHNPIRTAADVAALKPIDVEGDLGHVLRTIEILDRELTVPLISFAGAPFTIASYLIEGKPSRNYIRTKTMMYSEPQVWFALMDKLADMAITYLRAHIASGAKAVQLFDSWAGALSPADFLTYALPAIHRIFSGLADLPVPKIYYPGVSSGELLPVLRELAVDVVGLDWRVSLAEGRRRTDNRFAVQGNLDPYVLTAPLDFICEKAKAVMDEGIQSPGFIFNLGHGLFPEADLGKLRDLTAYVHEYSRSQLS
jgi:uroporphyrinogen decarboxylase